MRNRRAAGTNLSPTNGLHISCPYKHISAPGGGILHDSTSIALR